MSILEYTSCSSNHCAFCGDSLMNTPTLNPVAYGAPFESQTKPRPLRWQFLTNKAPSLKYMCIACTEKRRVLPQQCERPAIFDTARDEAQIQSQQRRSKGNPAEVEQETFQEQCLDQKSSREHGFSRRRRRGSSQTSNAPQDCGKPCDSSAKKRSGHTIKHKSLTNQCLSLETVPRQRSATYGQFTSCDKNESSTAEMLALQLPLERPLDRVDSRSSSMTFRRATEPRQEDDISHGVAQQKEHSVEERQRRQSASYAHMLVRMRQHYDTVQVNRIHGYCATAPPRRIRHERRVQSVQSRDENEPTKADSSDVAIDLAYLRVYKDAR